MTPMKNIALALLSAVLAALVTAAIWTYVPVLVATQLGADDGVLIIFFLFGPLAGVIAGGLAGFLLRIIRPGSRLWPRYLILLGSVLAIGALLGAIFGDYRCTGCF
jgi:uncharacterized membrane protein